jgi:hypothetical protein
MRERIPLLLISLAFLLALQLAVPWHRESWLDFCHWLLRPLGADRWFSVTEEFALPEDGCEGKLAELTAVCRHRLDEEVGCRIEMAGDGRTARVTLRTWYPDAKKLLREIRKAWEAGKGAQYLEVERELAEKLGVVPDGTKTSGGMDWTLPDGTKSGVRLAW